MIGSPTIFRFTCHMNAFRSAKVNSKGVWVGSETSVASSCPHGLGLETDQPSVILSEHSALVKARIARKVPSS